MARNGGSLLRVSRSGDGQPEESRDRLSELPDSLLHLILVLVPIIDAVRTCVLSRRWRGFWQRLPSLFFDDVEVPRVLRFPGLVEGVLRGYADDVDMGDLFVSVKHRDSVDDPVDFVATLADLAAHRISGRFDLYLSPAAVNLYSPEDDDDDEEAVTLQLPCFQRVTELCITFVGVDLGMTMDTFAKLTKLLISGAQFKDGGEQISQVVSLFCPCIETLELHRIHGLSRLRVSAKSLVSMVLSKILVLEYLLLSAKNLRHLLVDKCFVLCNAEATMCLDVPALEQLVWQDRCPEVIRDWVLPSCLQRLVVAEVELNYLFGDGDRSDFTRILQLFKCVDTLRLEFPTSMDPGPEKFMDTAKLPCYSELEFIVNRTSHKFGPTILTLLRKCSCVKKVTVHMFIREVGYMYTPCPSNCTCRQPSVWTDNAINLDSIESVAVYEFCATQDEMSFIYYIMRNAKRLRMVSILFSLSANPTRRFFRKLCKLSASSGCAVEFYSHRKLGLQMPEA